MAIRQVHENDHAHFVVDDSGAMFPIAKAGLSEAARARIQRFSEGGEVKAIDEVDPETVAAEEARAGRDATYEEQRGLPPRPPPTDPAALLDLARVAGSDEGIDKLLDLGRVSTAEPPAPIAPAAPVEDPGLASTVAEGDLLAENAAQAPTDWNALKRFHDSMIHAQGGFGADGATAGAVAPVVTETAPLPVVAEPLAKPAVLPAVAPRGGGGGTGGGGMSLTEPPPDPGLAQSYEDQKQAARDLAAMAHEKALLEQKNAQERALAQQKFDDETAARVAARQAQADTMRAEIRDGKLDPNKLWNSLDSSQQVGVGISLFLGGFASGMLGGPNQALAIFNKRIDDDLRSQEHSLGTKKTLLSEFMAEGHSLAGARELARSHMLDGIAATMERDSAKLGGQKADAIALDTSAQLQRAAIEGRAKATTQFMENRVRQAQIRNIEAEAAQHRALAAEARAKANGEGSGQQYEIDALAGRAIPAAGNAALSPATRGVMARMPDGTLRAATGVIGKQTVEAASSAYADTSKNLDAYEAIRAKYPNGWQTGLTPGQPLQDKAAAQALYEKLRFGIARMNEPVGILTEKDIDRAGAFVPDVTDSSIVFDTKVRRLAELRNVLQSRMQSIYDAHLVGGAKVPRQIEFSAK